MADHIHIFIDDNAGYIDWVKKSESGYVVNCNRKPNSEYLILHRADCNTILQATRWHGNWTNTGFIKVCSLDKTKLSKWAKATIGGELQGCQVCNP